MEIGELANCTRSTTKQNTTHIEMKIHVRTSWSFPTTGCKYSFYMQRTKFVHIYSIVLWNQLVLYRVCRRAKNENISLIFCNGQFPMSNTECYIILDLCIRQHSYLKKSMKKPSLMEAFKRRHKFFQRHFMYLLDVMISKVFNLQNDNKTIQIIYYSVLISTNHCISYQIKSQ